MRKRSTYLVRWGLCESCASRREPFIMLPVICLAFYFLHSAGDEWSEFFCPPTFCFDVAMTASRLLNCTLRVISLCGDGYSLSSGLPVRVNYLCVKLDWKLLATSAFVLKLFHWYDVLFKLSWKWQWSSKRYTYCTDKIVECSRKNSFLTEIENTDLIWVVEYAFHFLCYSEIFFISL